MAVQDQPMPNLNSRVVDRDGQITPPWRRFFQTLWDRTGSASGTPDTIPAGTIAQYAGASAPSGWYFLEGQSLLVSTDPDLFAVFGYTYGGSGPNFNLPNTKDKFVIGAGASHALGTTGGNTEIVLDVLQLPDHKHQITDPGHSHLLTDPGHTHGGIAGAALQATGATKLGVVAGNSDPQFTGITVDTAFTGIFETDLTGAGDPINIEPPYLALKMMIKR